jgi:uncharacterized phiE125 gp8 family phage protein
VVLDQVTAPTEEPVSLAEAKEHLRINSASFATAITEERTIKPDNHATAASYSLTGSAISVLGYRSAVMLNSGTITGSATIDVKIQEAASAAATFTDWAGSAFTQVTTANDDAIQEIQYTGTQSYVRAAATVAVEKCDFSVTVVKESPSTVEDDYITNLIKAARQYCEKISNQAFCTQTWDLYFDTFPDVPFHLPLPPVQTVSSIIYTNTDNEDTTVTAGTYIVDKHSYPARVNLSYGYSWPSQTLTTLNGFRIRYITGYGSAGTVPYDYKQAMLMLVGHMYETREQTVTASIGQKNVPIGLYELLGIDRVIVFP